MNPESSTLYVQSLATGIAVLDAFNAERASMSLPDIAAAAGISRSAAQRFAYTLEALGLLDKDPSSKRYSLSARTLDNACRYLESHPLLDRANPFLLDLNRKSGETVNLAEPLGLDMIFIGRFPSPQRLLVHMLASERVRYTPNTLTDVDALMQQVRESRERGFAYCNEEYYRGDLALAVPVYDLSKRVVAGLQLSVSASKWTVRRALSRFIPLMQETARLISTTPPTPRALVPFGGGAARDLHATPPGSQG